MMVAPSSTTKYRREYYRTHRKECIGYHKKWKLNHPGADTIAKRKTIQKDPERHRARTIAGRYAKIGLKCEKCSSINDLEMHHEDYSKILDVNTLCKQCHEARHLELKLNGLEIPRPTIEELRNRHCNNCVKTHPECGRGYPSFKGRPCNLWIKKDGDKQ
jgi:hypothetical protein